MEAAMTAGPSHFSLSAASLLMQPSMVWRTLNKEDGSRDLISFLKLLLIVTVHFMTPPISFKVGKPAFLSPASRGSSTDLTADPIFLMTLIANLAFFFLEGVLVELESSDGAFDAFDLEEEEAALVT